MAKFNPNCAVVAREDMLFLSKPLNGQLEALVDTAIIVKEDDKKLFNLSQTGTL